MARANGISIKGITQLDRIITFHTDGLEAALHSRRTMSPFINAFGRDTNMRFSDEVSPTGRSWQSLTGYTNEKREERGYPPTSPILEQSGQLRAAAATPFLKWGANTGKSTRSFNAPYGNHHNIKMVASNSGGRFHAQISGPRVANQYGGSIKKAKGFYTSVHGTYAADRYGAYYSRGSRGKGNMLPARPFWGITPAMINDGFKSFRWIFPDEWRKQAKGLWVR